MTEYGTIKIPAPAYEHHNERRKEMGQTWEQYINGQAPEVSNNAEVDTNELAREVAAQLDYAQIAGQTAGELEGRLR